MQGIFKIIMGLLAAFGLAAEAKGKLDAAQAGQPPRNIGKLDPNDPVALGDFNFDLMQAEGMGNGAAFAKEHGFKSYDKAEDAILRIRAYNSDNPSFAAAVNARVGERTQALMANPMAMAEQYQDWQQPQA